MMQFILLSDRYRLHFEVETQKELDRRKHDAKTKPLNKIEEVTCIIYGMKYNYMILF